MRKLVLFFGLLLISIFSSAQTDEFTVTKSPKIYEKPKTITLANGKVISYKKWCRQYDRASRKAIRKLNRKMKKEFKKINENE